MIEYYLNRHRQLATMVPSRRTFVLALSTAFAGCGSISGDGNSPTDASPGESNGSPTRTPSGRSTEPTQSPTDEGTRAPDATDTPSPTLPDGPCEVGVPSITETFVETLDTSDTPEDWTRRTGIQLPTISLDSSHDSPGILVFGSITGNSGCAYPTLVGTDYSDRRSELTIDMGIEQRSGPCDAGTTTRIYRAWLSLAEPTFPRGIRLRQADFEETRTYAVGPIDCR